MIGTISMVSANDLCQELIERTEVVEDASIPRYLPYRNDKINIFDPNEELIGHLETSNGKVESIGCEALDEPNIHAYISDLEVIDIILDSDDPLKELNARLKEDIILEGQSFGSQTKLVVSRMFIRIASLF